MPVDDTSGYQTCANCGLETGFEEIGAQTLHCGSSSPPCGLRASVGGCLSAKCRPLAGRSEF
jgi:hypothetical protein